MRLSKLETTQIMINETLFLLGISQSIFMASSAKSAWSSIEGTFRLGLRQVPGKGLIFRTYNRSLQC